MVDVKLNPGAAASVTALPPMQLPDGVPHFSIAEVEASCRRSPQAFRLHRDFQEAVDDGRVFSRFEVRDLLDRCKTPDGKSDGHSGVVAAYYAEHHSEIFDPGARKEITTFLKGVDWKELVADLKAFMNKLKEEAAAAERERQVKADLLKDEIKRDDTKHGAIKEAVTSAERKADDRKRLANKSESFLEDELSSSGAKMSDVQKEVLKRHVRGFTNKS